MKVFDLQKHNLYHCLISLIRQTKFYGWSMRWWPGSNNQVLVLDQETKMQHKFDPTSPTHSNYRYHWPFLYLGPSLYSVISFPPIPIVPTPTWKGKSWAKRKVDLEELAFPAACSGVLKMLFFTKPFLPNAFLLKFCHFPFSFSPWKREVTYRPLV